MNSKFVFFFLLFVTVVSSCKTQNKSKEKISDYVSLIQNDSLSKLDVFIDGIYFTSYLYADSILRKPVLFPIHTANGKRITRGFPISPNSGERIDHPHHYGLWFNHGDVNGVDYWNSAVIAKDKNAYYGRINHVKFQKVVSGKIGILEVEKEWRNNINELILIETTQYTFSGSKNERIITHSTTLFAPEVDVLFKDSKEGMFALRVRRELELVSDKPDILLDKNLVPLKVATVNNEKVSGSYLNSSGLDNYPEVWGKRAKWMRLSGIIDKDTISILLLDHLKNPNHPPHWMARDYGLFGVNSFGSYIYTEGKEKFNFKLKKGESVTFKNQVIINDGFLPDSTHIENEYHAFINND
tara:strand:- start:2645 stop:3709 length:1065 start_codon:yes stop_codon:yes gene_type:complete